METTDEVDVIPCRAPAGDTGVAVFDLEESTSVEDVERVFATFGLIYRVALEQQANGGSFAVVTYFSEKTAAKAAERANGATIGLSSRPCQTRVMPPLPTRFAKILPLDKVLQIRDPSLPP